MFIRACEFRGPRNRACLRGIGDEAVLGHLRSRPRKQAAALARFLPTGAKWRSLVHQPRKHIGRPNSADHSPVGETRDTRRPPYRGGTHWSANLRTTWAARRRLHAAVL